MTSARPPSTRGRTKATGRKAVVLLLLLGSLAGCQNRSLAGTLRTAGVGASPDEFMVLPTRPLEMPTNLASLPVPTPGAANRVDYQPRAEALAGLTGRPTLATADGRGLVARGGAGDPSIRPVLAAEDAQYRAGNPGRLLERVFARDKDALVYRGMALAPAGEYERIRAAGIGVPAAPPALLQED